MAALLGLVWLALAHPQRRPLPHGHTKRQPTVYFRRRLKHNGASMMMTDATPSPLPPAPVSPLAHSASQGDSKGFSFQLLAQQGQARAGLFCTPHGPVQTPMFMPVGTQSTLKTLTWQQVAATGAQMVLSNAYHLYLKPGPALIAKAGGLHGWMNWQGPILTDSGGFQVFSLAGLRRITEAGVHFTNPTDGSKHFIGPEEAMRIQNQLGADVMMAFDECTPYPATLEEATTSLERTQRWLERCWASHERVGEQALFPIVQGGTHEALRAKAAAHVAQYPAVGYAIGGVSVGEPRPAIHAITAFTAPLLPANKPRYLMGVGTPEDLLEGIKAGVDLFDCVLPTRNARHGTFFSPWGNEHIKKACFTEDFGPLVAGCECFACTQHSRAYIRHLVRQGEVTGSTLLSIHNIHTLIALAKEARLHVLQGTFDAFYAERMAQLGTNKAKRSV